jgi:hypothetical protein
VPNRLGHRRDERWSRPVSTVRFRGLQLEPILTQVGQCPVKAHTLRLPGATPGPAI